ncbi:MAG: hypothetical protein J6U89_03565 [Bacteroidaceae bacterium]|jgi:hypothetical protein|nr:hypothetical protein [Bacteroidaceae bacterium]MBQ5616962.1 hypothetical protein [Bacteroidaceae bacterium]
MKILFKVLLGVLAAVLVIVNFRSVMSPIKFEEIRAQRDSAVIYRLIDIKNAEVEYYRANGRYTNSFDTLINFVKTQKVYTVKKAYELNDRQLEKVADIEKERRKVREITLSPDDADRIFLDLLRTAEKKNDWKIIDEINAMNKDGGDLRNFRRDTTWVSLIDTLYHDPNFNVDELPYIPYGNGEKFTLLTDSIAKAGGGHTQLFEARADFSQYLTGINDQEYDNYILGVKKKVTQVRREPVLNEKGEPMFDEYDEEIVRIIPCRRVGSVKEANNNAGNWEW